VWGVCVCVCVCVCKWAGGEGWCIMKGSVCACMRDSVWGVCMGGGGWESVCV